MTLTPLLNLLTEAGNIIKTIKQQASLDTLSLVKQALDTEPETIEDLKNKLKEHLDETQINAVIEYSSILSELRSQPPRNYTPDRNQWNV